MRGYLEYDCEVISLQVCVDGDEVGSELHAVHPGLEPAAVLVLRVVVHEHGVAALSRLGPVSRASRNSGKNRRSRNCGTSEFYEQVAIRGVLMIG